jgi:transposase
MRAYSLDLRLKIVQALDRGLPPSQVAAAFGVGVSSVRRYRQQWRATGDLAPRPIPGDTPLIGREQYPALRAQVARQPDATLAEHCQAWEQATGVRVSLATMSRTLTRLGLPLKKSA